MFAHLKEKAAYLARQVKILLRAYAHPKLKWYVKAWLALVISYAVSPIDLIPDFIPILGLLDDVLLIPLGVAIAIRMIPKEIWEECAQKSTDAELPNRYRIIGVTMVILVWVLIMFLIFRLI